VAEGSSAAVRFEGGPASRSLRCLHCGTAVEDPEDTYCCRGCEIAAAIIRGAGLGRYYEEREEFAPRPQPALDAWHTIPVHVGEDGVADVRLMVDGLRCASCVWVTENVLQRTPGVVEAAVSYATGRATLRWDPARVDLPSLAGRIAALGYRPRLLGEESRPDRDLLLRLGVAAFAASNIMLIYVALYAGWFGGMDARFVTLFQWASLVLATPIALWCAVPFFSGAIQGLRHGVLHMDLPIALAVAVLYGHGVFTTFWGGHAYLDSLGMLVALLLAGRMLEGRSRRRAAEAAVSLAATVPATARRIRNGEVRVVAADELRPGEIIDVGTGEECAADGTVVDGAGTVRMAIITGEARPVAIGPGDRVVAGAVLQDGAVTLRVEAAGQETVLQRMAEQLRSAADRGARPSRSDRIAPWFTAGTLLVAGVTFAVWLIFSGVGVALTTCVAVLVVACPCALALSRPLAAAAGLGAAARRGLLFRSADALLDLVDADVVALDKTGTVTRGELTVLRADDATLRVAAGLERFSAHPIAAAITAEAARRNIPLPRAEGVRERVGEGVSGFVDGREWTLRSGGPGRVVLVDARGSRAEVHLGDSVRSDSRRAVRAIRALGLDVVLLTGDHEEVASAIAEEAGIQQVIPRVDPEGKAEWIRSRQEAGHRVLFAGDGVNDGPGLAQADVGVAMGTGAASSLLVADGVVSQGSILPIEVGIRAARACRRAIRLNQARSIGYNVLAVSAAAVGWVNPLVAAVLMPLSSLMVIWGASRVEAVVRGGSE
jgi:Cu2+-exporting ATPase